MTKGNNETQWNKLLEILDDKLQLGLLDRLKKLTSYHFEADTLYLQPANHDEFVYLGRYLQQLQLIAQETLNIEHVKLVESR